MVFTDPVVADDQLVRDRIRSQNYAPGAAGWAITRDGNAEFNDVTLRGQIIADLLNVDTPGGLAWVLGGDFSLQYVGTNPVTGAPETWRMFEVRFENGASVWCQEIYSKSIVADGNLSGIDVNASGNVKATGTVTCRSCNVAGHVIVTRAPAFLVPSGGGGTDITWAAEERDMGGMWSGGGSNIVLPYTGIYTAIANTTWQVQAGGVRSLSIKLGGPVVAENKMNSTGQSEPQSVATEFRGTAGQIVSAAAFQTSGVGVNIINSRLSVRLTGQ